MMFTSNTITKTYFYAFFKNLIKKKYRIKKITYFSRYKYLYVNKLKAKQIQKKKEDTGTPTHT